MAAIYTSSEKIHYDRKFSIHEFRTNMAEALEALENGETIVLTRYNKIVALMTGEFND